MKIAQDGSSRNSVKNFRFEGSNDDSDWTILLTAQSLENEPNYQEWVFCNDTAYEYYRVYVIDSWSDNYSISIYEIEMLSCSSSSSSSSSP
jgi:hypothetical protein